MDFKGKVAIVTGGAQGIGKAISTAFLKAGMKVLVCDINDTSAKSFLAELPADLKSNAVFQKCDVSSYDSFKAAFEKAKSLNGRIDVVVNNAGIINEQNWKKMVDVNFIGTTYGIHLALEYMGKNNGGSGGAIINTSSVAGVNGSELTPVYAGTKHGVIGLTRSYCLPYFYDKSGVTVNAICPGPVDTPLYHVFAASTVDEEYTKQFLDRQTLISPDEIAKGVMTLLEEGKNGAVMSIDAYFGARYEVYHDCPLR